MGAQDRGGIGSGTTADGIEIRRLVRCRTAALASPEAAARLMA
jgi:hypothetical protein